MGYDKIQLKGRVWVERGDETYLAYGRIILLQKIKRYGSILKAAKSMKISYKHAWELVDSMNRHSREPLVVKTTGGRGGGGAKLTDAGRRAISAFLTFWKKFRKFLKTTRFKI